MATKKTAATVEDAEPVEGTAASNAEAAKAATLEKRELNAELLDQAHAQAEHMVDIEQDVEGYPDRVAAFKEKQAQAEADYLAQLPKQQPEQRLERAMKIAATSPPLKWDFTTNDAGQVIELQVLEVQDRIEAEGEIKDDRARVAKRIIEGVPETGDPE